MAWGCSNMPDREDRRQHARVVRPREEVAVARVLGAAHEEATTLVDLLAERELLVHGVAAVVAAAAVRWGPPDPWGRGRVVPGNRAGHVGTMRAGWCPGRARSLR